MKMKTKKFIPWLIATEYSQPGGVSLVMWIAMHTLDLKQGSISQLELEYSSFYEYKEIYNWF